MNHSTAVLLFDLFSFTKIQPDRQYKKIQRHSTNANPMMMFEECFECVLGASTLLGVVFTTADGADSGGSAKKSSGTDILSLFFVLLDVADFTLDLLLTITLFGEMNQPGFGVLLLVMLLISVLFWIWSRRLLAAANHANLSRQERGSIVIGIEAIIFAIQDCTTLFILGRVTVFSERGDLENTNIMVTFLCGIVIACRLTMALWKNKCGCCSPDGRDNLFSNVFSLALCVVAIFWFLVCMAWVIITEEVDGQEMNDTRKAFLLAGYIPFVLLGLVAATKAFHPLPG